MCEKKQALLECVNAHMDDAWSVCTAVWDFILSQSEEDQPSYFSLFLSQISIEELDYEDVNEFLPNDVRDKISEDIHRLVHRVVENLVRQRLSEEDFYQSLWNKIGDPALLPDKMAQISFLTRLWLDTRIPYYQVGEGCTMEDSEFRRIQDEIWPVIKKAYFILSIPMEQKTQRASLIMNLAAELKDDRERAVFWAGVMAHLKEAARPPEKSDT